MTRDYFILATRYNRGGALVRAVVRDELSALASRCSSAVLRNHILKVLSEPEQVAV